MKIMGTQSTRGTYPEQFYPNTEILGEQELRITALGTGRPFLRRSQANASWLIELGNEDKFVFDFGFGSQMNFTALEIPYGDINAYFATHLHTDHVGDFGQVWVGSWAGGRLKPLEVYGPSGPEPKYGFKYFCEKQLESYVWDRDTRGGGLPAAAEGPDPDRSPERARQEGHRRPADHVRLPRGAAAAGGTACRGRGPGW